MKNNIEVALNNKLENPTWFSLQETHGKWNVSFDSVVFYNPEICPFGAFTDVKKTAKALTEYAKLTDKFFLVSENIDPIWDENFVVLNEKIEGLQMVLEHLPEIDYTHEIIPLTTKHIDEIYNLVWLVMPGFYRKKTIEMGNFFGIFEDNKLVAITGQRMQTDAFIEISSVVTHPDYTRRGLAKQLTHYTALDIIKQKKHPILHTTKGNTAIKLYEKLGFKYTRDMNWWYFNKK